jgi:hypothetical protein
MCVDMAFEGHVRGPPPLVSRIIWWGGMRLATHSYDSTKQIFQTPYIEMCFWAINAPTEYSIIAACCSWLTLAGFLVLPSTFSSLASSNILNSSESGKLIRVTIESIPRLWIAVACCVAGNSGTLLLWFLWRGNYVWLINEIFSCVHLLCFKAKLIID